MAKKVSRVQLSRRLVRPVLDSALTPVLAGFGSLWIYLVYFTTRWRYSGRENLDAALAEPGFIASVWHGRLAMIAMLRPRGRRAVALISRNRDGAMLARMMRNLGAEAVFGSGRDPGKEAAGPKVRGAAAAVQRSVTALREGAILVITPDGPRGPAMRAKPGVSAIAAHAGAAVLPVAYSTRRAKVFETWDRFLAPWPFTRGAFVFGPLISPPADPSDPASLERHRSAVEEAMIRATEQADRLVGRETPRPDQAQDAAEAGA
ncbi:MAG: lysophospholipid acyltransferase family protein [Pseudomonadota bacterium]